MQQFWTHGEGLEIDNSSNGIKEGIHQPSKWTINNLDKEK
jgi:hypothetical protein